MPHREKENFFRVNLPANHSERLTPSDGEGTNLPRACVHRGGPAGGSRVAGTYTVDGGRLTPRAARTTPMTAVEQARAAMSAKCHGEI